MKTNPTKQAMKGRPRVGSSASRRSRPTAALRRRKAELPTRDKYVLRLFVAGATAHSRQAIIRVQELCAAELKDTCDLQVIDIYQQPELARANQIVATPTLIVEFPPPLRRFIGNLTNITGLFVALEVTTNGKIVL